MKKQYDFKQTAFEKYKEFVSINRHCMTAREIAKELGVSDSFISNLCHKYNFKCITAGQRNKEFILKNKDKFSYDEMAVKLDISITTLRSYCAELGICLSSIKVAVDENDELRLVRVRNVDDPLNKTVRIKDRYNQISSDFLDEIHGIKTTIRK